MDGRSDAVARLRGLAVGAAYEAKTVIARVPTVALPLQRMRGRGEVVDGDTEIVIESFPRSASTFAVAAFRLAQEPRAISIAHHTHVTAQVLEGVRRGLPTLVLIRDPEQALISHMIRTPGLPARSAVRGYVRFYEPIEPVLPRVVVGTFEQVVRGFGAVIRRVNATYGTSFVPFEHTSANVERIEGEIETDARRQLTTEELERAISRPSEARRTQADELRARLAAVKDGSAWRRTQELYRTFATAAGA